MKKSDLYSYGPLQFRDEINCNNGDWDKAINALLDNNYERMACIAAQLTDFERKALLKYTVWMRRDEDNGALIRSLINPNYNCDNRPSVYDPHISIGILGSSKSYDPSKSAQEEQRIVSISLPQGALKDSRKVRHPTPRRLSYSDVIRSQSLSDHQG